MADAYLAQYSMLYRPAAGDDLLMVDYNDIITDMLDWNPSVNIQADEVVGSPWQKRIPRGNASIGMSVTVARAYQTREQAESAAYLSMRYLVDNPAGTLIYRYAYEGDEGEEVYTREDKWLVTLDSIKPVAMTSDTWFGIITRNSPSYFLSPQQRAAVNSQLANIMMSAWSAVTYSLTLTKSVTK